MKTLKDRLFRKPKDRLFAGGNICGAERELPEGLQDALDLAYADPPTVSLAKKCAFELRRLVEEAALTHFLNATAACASGEGLTTAEWLARALESISAERAAWKAESEVAAQRRRARRERMQPLEAAVSARYHREQGICAGSRRELDALVHATAVERDVGGPWDKAIAAGLTQAQIVAVGIVPPKLPQETVAVHRQWLQENIAEAERVMARLTAWRADPLRRPHHLAGLGILPEEQEATAAVTA